MLITFDERAVDNFDSIFEIDTICLLAYLKIKKIEGHF